MATIDDFTRDELRLIQHAPVHVIAGAVASGEEGVTGSMVEMIDGVERFAQSMASAADSLLTSIFASIDQTQPDDFDITQVSDPVFRDAIIEKGLKAAAEAKALLLLKADPEDAETYAAGLINAARAAVHAARSGGFLGFGSVEVTDEEAEYVGQLITILGAAQSEV
ncbi:MAG: hypothetical protein IT335_11835 [Thermomicrobiales bacterium]|nr:hypothetical protein [Thermomicrobiales bacterium]